MLFSSILFVRTMRRLLAIGEFSVIKKIRDFILFICSFNLLMIEKRPIYSYTRSIYVDFLKQNV
uniref:Putative ovule protein n=1 Tax=Solanum chacoense TaxID=4108 RepID=A0A0V0GL28_SOLCH